MRNLKRATETIDLMVDNLETEDVEGQETGFTYIYQNTRAAIGDLSIVQDLVKDELREN